MNCQNHPAISCTFSPASPAPPQPPHGLAPLAAARARAPPLRLASLLASPVVARPRPCCRQPLSRASSRSACSPRSQPSARSLAPVAPCLRSPPHVARSSLPPPLARCRAPPVLPAPAGGLAGGRARPLHQGSPLGSSAPHLPRACMPTSLGPVTLTSGAHTPDKNETKVENKIK